MLSRSKSASPSPAESGAERIDDQTLIIARVDGVSRLQEPRGPHMEQVKILQDQIDDIDEKIVGLLGERFLRSRQIGTIKRRENQPPVDPVRRASQKQRFIAKCAEANLDLGFAERLISTIADQVIAERAECWNGDV
jgi:chorismate mutase